MVRSGRKMRAVTGALRAARHAAPRTAAQHRGRRRTRDTGHAVASRATRNTKDAAARRPQGTLPPAKQQETQRTLSHRHGAIMSAGQYGEYPHCSLHAAHSLEIFLRTTGVPNLIILVEEVTPLSIGK